jgi:hypothetical protein
MSDSNVIPMPIGVGKAEVMYWRFIEFNDRRAMRSKEAARVEVDPDGDWLWMSRKDIKNNIKDFGDHPELKKALVAYGAWE